MINKKFEAYKIKRELKKSGEKFTFYRQSVNDFNEPTGEEEDIGSLVGLYHEQNSRIQVTTGDVAQTRTKKLPTILCSYDDCEKLKIKMNDILIFNDKRYKVTGIVNIQEWNIVSDISLEVCDYGSEN